MSNPKSRPRRGKLVSLHPLATDDALRALLKVKPADVKKLEQKEASQKKGRRAKK